MFKIMDDTIKKPSHISGLAGPGSAAPVAGGPYLGEQGVLAAGLQRGIVPVLHGQPAVDVEARHEVGLAGLRVLQALRDEGRAPLGQQQELLDALRGSIHWTIVNSGHM